MIERIEQIERPVAPLLSKAMVCVVDSDPESLRYLSRLFRDANLVVRSFASAIDFLENGQTSSPACLVIEPALRGMDGFELQRTLAGSATQFVFLSSKADVPMCVRAMKAGAVDFLTKPVEPETLLEAAARGLARSQAAHLGKAVRSAALGKVTSLTSRELAVMHRVVAGMLNKQIAAELGIAEKTIKVHRGRVMRKTGAVSVPDLVRLVITAGIPNLVKKPETA